MKKHILMMISSIVIIGMAGCSKEKSTINRLSGVWDVTSYEQTWYTDNSVDSTLLSTDSLGWIGLYNNGNRYLNEVSPSSTFLPYSFVIQGISQFSPLNWESDRGSGKTLAFYKFEDLSNNFVRYSVDKNVTGRKIILTYVQHTNDKISYREVIKLNKK